uniref:EF-hand domain-containing protein n=1 Tax=Zooxanthella nutricula TaxID=1333877 RepID=A0A7S2PWA0_9DINO
MIGYTDDELIEWRQHFDELAKEEMIDFPAFEQFVKRKFEDVMDESSLARQVQYLWEKFDRDGSNNIDFGEFIEAGLAFDVLAAKDHIRSSPDGILGTFQRYAEDGFMSEPGFFQLMCDYRFFVATATDVRKLVKVADEDRDGLVNLQDFTRWCESCEFELETKSQRKKRLAMANSGDDDELGAGSAAGAGGLGGRRRVPMPPPEPQD